jgi:hypothetical protein
MHVRHRGVLVLLALSLLGSVVVAAQKGGKPKPALMHATASFRCGAVDPDWSCSAEGFDVPDSIIGDGGSYVGTGDLLSGSGALLRDDGEAHFDIRAGSGRRIHLSFAAQVAGPSGSFFRKWFTQPTLDSFHWNTNVINPGTGLEAEGGLRAIPSGYTWPSRINAFWIDTYGVTYNIRFNPDHYPGSGYVWITRHGDTTWTIEALPADPARLLSIVDQKGKPVAPTDEGLYTMPFKITFTVP